MKKSIMLLTVILTVGFIGCSNTKGTEQKSNLTAGMVKKEVVKGVTNQNDIMQIFGAPNMVTKNKSGNEVWSYNKMFTDSSQENINWGLLLIGGNSAVNSRSTNTFDLILIFDENDVVKDYSMISSKY